MLKNVIKMRKKEYLTLKIFKNKEKFRKTKFVNFVSQWGKANKYILSRIFCCE